MIVYFGGSKKQKQKNSTSESFYKLYRNCNKNYYLNENFRVKK